VAPFVALVSGRVLTRLVFPPRDLPFFPPSGIFNVRERPVSPLVTGPHGQEPFTIFLFCNFEEVFRQNSPPPPVFQSESLGPLFLLP